MLNDAFVFQGANILLFCNNVSEIVIFCSLSHPGQGYGSENYCCCDFAVCSGSLKYCFCSLQRIQNFFPKVSAVCRKPDFGNIPLTSTQQKHDTTRHKTMRFYPEATDKQLQTVHFAGATNSNRQKSNRVKLFNPLLSDFYTQKSFYTKSFGIFATQLQRMPQRLPMHRID